MAQRVQTVLVDDIDGAELDDSGATVSFSLDGITYEIDLSRAHREALQAVLTPYIVKARSDTPAPIPRRVIKTLPSRIDKAQLDAMRSWAVEHGYQVSRRGRVPQHVQDAYHGSRHGA